MATFRPVVRSGWCGAALAAALLLAGTAPPARAALLYGTTAISESPRTSDYGSSTQSGWRSFENFTIASGGTVQRITWSGLWFGDLQPAPPPAPDALSWDIVFYASTGTAPGAQLSLQNFAAAQVTSTFLGNGVLSLGANTNYNASFYEYSIDITTPFVAQAGTEYWLSVMSQSTQLNPSFAWSGATGGDGSSYQQLLGAGMSVTDEFTRARDRYVVLEGELAVQAVPEPGSAPLAVLALGALALALARRPSSAPERRPPEAISV